MADKSPPTCAPNSAFELVDWRDYFDIGAGFSTETMAGLKKALNNLAQTPEFARLCKLAQKRYAQFKQLNTQNTHQRHTETVHAQPKIKVTCDVECVADFYNHKIGFQNKPDYGYFISAEDSKARNTDYTIGSFEHILIHELLHLTDPIIMLRTCSDDAMLQFNKIIPIGILYACMNTGSKESVGLLEDNYTVPNTNDIMKRRFSEPKRPHFDSGIRIKGRYTPKIHEHVSMNGVPLERIDTLRLMLDRAIETAINPTTYGTEEAKQYSSTLKIVWKSFVNTIQVWKPQLNRRNFNPADAVYVEMALRQLEEKQVDGPHCNPPKPFNSWVR